MDRPRTSGVSSVQNPLFRALTTWVAITWFLLDPIMRVSADEGMWLLNDPPRQHLAKKYNFDLTREWLERAQLASVRFNNGGSGSFVSPDGLIVTNHHIGADCLQKLSSKDHDLLHDGFYARSRNQELKCQDLELNVLQTITDVTDRVNAAVKPDMSSGAALRSRPPLQDKELCPITTGERRFHRFS